MIPGHLEYHPVPGFQRVAERRYYTLGVYTNFDRGGNFISAREYIADANRKKPPGVPLAGVTIGRGASFRCK